MAAEGGQNSKSRPCNPYWLQALANDREDVERLLLEGGGSTKSLQQCLGLLKQLKADHGAGMHMQAWGGEYEGPISVCEVLIAASGGDWEAVLQLPGTGSSPARDIRTVRSSYRRLSRLVHPDKCRWPWAEEAFKALQAAAQKLLRGEGDVCNGVEGATRSSEPECWGSWEEPEQRTSESCRVNTDPEWQAEEQRLGAMGSEELRQEVGRLQRAVMNSLYTPREGRNVRSLQASLRFARTALSACLDAAKSRGSDEGPDGRGFYSD